MSYMIRNTQNFIPYLLPAALLATAGILLMGLLYYPNPSVHTDRSPQTTMSMSGYHWRTQTDALIADALRQLQAEQQTQVHIPRYWHERSILPEEQSGGLRAAPLIIENDGRSGHPVLIRL